MAEMQTVPFDKTAKAPLIPWGGHWQIARAFFPQEKKVNCVRIKRVSVKLGLKRHNIFEVEEEIAVLFSSKPALPVWTVVIPD